MCHGRCHIGALDARHDLRRVEVAHQVDDVPGFIRLKTQHALREIAEIEPHCNRQCQQSAHNRKHQ
jgi:hypothetical protein